MVDFRILGPVELGPADAPVPLRGHRRRGVLAVLLLHANQVVGMSQLVGSLFPEPTRSAESNVRTQVSALRRLFGEHLGEPDRITTRPSGYVLEVRDGELDLHAFERLTADGQAALADGDPERAMTLLARARDLWRGPALDGASASAALAAEAARLDEHRIAATESWADALIAAERPADALGELRRLVTAHPLRERAWALLMVALAEAGQPAAALTAYQQVRAGLANRLGTDPAARLQRLYERILRGEPLRAGPRRPAPERTVVPRQLPAGTAAFTGRVDELARLNALLPAGGVAVLTGTAGVGKTTLAVRWAYEVTGRFADGTLYANLRGFGPEAPVPPIAPLTRFLHALGVRPEQIPLEPDEAAALYRSVLADRQVLVVLDDAADEEQVRPLLPGGPRNLAVVTSRRRLRGLVVREGARPVDLDVLPVADAMALLRRTLAPERAEAPAALAALAEGCGRLPLALRIAAAALVDEPDRTVEGFLARLAADRLDALRVEGDERSVVAAAIGYSYQRLPAADRRVFRLVGLAPVADLTPEATAALTGSTVREAEAALRRLAAAHLVTVRGAGRYGRHDLIRAYGTDRAMAEDTAEERAAALSALCAAYVTRTEAAMRTLHPEAVRLVPVPAGGTGFDSPAAARAWLDAERDNLTAIIEYRAAHPTGTAWTLADLLRGYFVHGRHMASWERIGTAALAEARAAGSAAGRAAGHLVLAEAYRWSSRFPQAREQYEAARAAAEEAALPDGVAAAVQGLGRLDAARGRLADAGRAYLDALSRFRATGNRPGEAAALGNLGVVAAEQGRLREAVERLTEALAIHRELGAAEATSLVNLGMIHYLLSDFTDARRHFEAALAGFTDRGSRGYAGRALVNLGDLAADRGDAAEAAERARRALEIGRDLSDHRVQQEANVVLGRAYLMAGELDPADAALTDALRLARTHGSPFGEAMSLAWLSVLARDRGLVARSVETAEAALAAARECGLPLAEQHCRLAVAAARCAAGDLAEAAEAARRAESGYRRGGNRLGEARALWLRDRIAGRAGEPVEAYRERVAALLAELDLPRHALGRHA